MVLLLDNSILLIKEIIFNKDSKEFKNNIIHWIKKNGDSWQLAFFLCLMQEKFNNPTQEIEEKFAEFHDFILKEKLAEIYQLKPLLDVIILFFLYFTEKNYCYFM